MSEAEGEEDVVVRGDAVSVIFTQGQTVLQGQVARPVVTSNNLKVSQMLILSINTKAFV